MRFCIRFYYIINSVCNFAAWAILLEVYCALPAYFIRGFPQTDFGYSTAQANYQLLFDYWPVVIAIFGVTLTGGYVDSLLQQNLKNQKNQEQIDVPFLAKEE